MRTFVFVGFIIIEVSKNPITALFLQILKNLIKKSFFIPINIHINKIPSVNCLVFSSIVFDLSESLSLTHHRLLK